MIVIGNIVILHAIDNGATVAFAADGDDGAANTISLADATETSGNEYNDRRYLSQ